MSKKIMTKNTDKQAIDNLADNFNGYAALLRKISKHSASCVFLSKL